jgi:hypothetical protein
MAMSRFSGRQTGVIGRHTKSTHVAHCLLCSQKLSEMAWVICKYKYTRLSAC